MTQICITLKSFDFLYILKAQNQIHRTIAFLQFVSKKNTDLPSQKIGLIHLPRSRKKLTVLRSPHIDKKSREQFELLSKKFRIQVTLHNSAKIYIFLGFLRSLKTPGVEVSLSINFSSFFSVLLFSKN